ncbi:MAG: hypothetical protein ACRC4M_04920 [Mycoplasma sp.]
MLIKKMIQNLSFRISEIFENNLIEKDTNVKEIIKKTIDIYFKNNKDFKIKDQEILDETTNLLNNITNFYLKDWDYTMEIDRIFFFHEYLKIIEDCFDEKRINVSKNNIITKK